MPGYLSGKAIAQLHEVIFYSHPNTKNMVHVQLFEKKPSPTYYLYRFLSTIVLAVFFLLKTGAQPQSEQWALSPNLVTFTPTPVGAPLSGPPPLYAINSMYDQNRNLLFFIVDQDIYAPNGTLLDVFQINGNPLTIGSEISIVEKPGNCDEYYMIGSYLNSLGNAWIPFYTSINMAIANGQLQYFGTNTNVFDLSAISPPLAFDDPALPNSEKNRFGLAVSSFRTATNDYFLFLKGFSSHHLYRYTLDASGITFDGTEVLTPALPVGADGGSNDTYPEMELIRLPNNGNYQMALVSGSDKIFIAEFDYSTGTSVANTARFVQIPFVANFKHQIKGLEFSPSGNLIYYTYILKNSSGITVSEHIGYVNLTQSTLATVEMLNANYTGANTLGNSFVEMGFDGKLYYNDGSRLMTLSTPDVIPSPGSWGVGLNLSQGTAQLLPDQIDGEFYQDNIPPCLPITPPDCCLAWVKQAGGIDQDVSNAIAVDAGGFVYTTGYFRGTTSFGSLTLTTGNNRDIYVTKQTAAGAFLWATKLGSVSDGEGRGIAVAPSGNVYITGYYNPTGIGQPDAFVAKLDANGGLGWLTPIASSFIDWGNGIALDANEDAYITGLFSNTAVLGGIPITSVGGLDVFLTKVSNSGAVLWAQSMGGTGSDVGNGIALDAGGNILVTGIFEATADFDPGSGVQNLTSAGGSDIFVAKYDPSGGLTWVQSAGGPLNDSGASITTDAGNDIYVTGDFGFSANFCTPVQSFTTGGLRDIFVWKLNALGNCVWVRQMGGFSSPATAGGRSIAVDGSGNVLTTGHFREPTDFDPGPLTYTLTPASGDDIFISKLDAQGDFMWAKQMGGQANDFGYGIALDAMGCIYTTGFFGSTGDFDPGPNVVNLTSAGAAEIFVHKLCMCAPCTCGTFSNMSIRWGGAQNVPVACGGAYQVPFGLPIVLSGDFQCQGNNCPTVTIDWALTDPSGNIVLSSSAPELPNPNFSIALTPSPFLLQGMYELTLIGHCGQDSCFCKIKFCPIITPNVTDTAVCKTDTIAYIPLKDCPNVCGITQVRWFVKPCSASVWPTTPYQVSSGTGCDDLLFLPYQYPGEACVEVYSEVSLDGRCCGTTLLTSNVARVTLCDPVSCTINNPNPLFCQSGNSAALQVSFPSAPPCSYTVQWYEQGVAINGATSLSYQPPTLVFPSNLPSSVCYYDYEFSVVLTGPCGPSTCATTIRVYNDNADAGQIDMIPFESQPFCPGEDATLVYSPACAELPTGPPPVWTWWSSTVLNPVFVQIPGSGTMDPVINTNKLFNTTWYKVIKQNGVCPADEIVYQIVVKDALVITNFTAVPDPCADTQVVLTVDFTPTPIAGTDTDTGLPCEYVIDWYLDGNLVHTSTSNVSSVSWTYPSPTPGLGSVAGVYYAVVRDNCCPQAVQTWPIIIAPTCVPVILGPCFRCDGDPSPITLTGVMVLPPKDPCPDLCTYQWYDGATGNPIPGATNATYVSATAGIFIFESNCNGCIRRDTHEVVQCIKVAVDDLGTGVQVQIYPNPTTQDMTVQISPSPLRNGMVKVVDVNGRVLASERIPDGQEKHTLSLAHLPTGLYFVQVFENDVLVWIDKIVRDQ